jgi:Flp pilus assembly protein TadG
MQSAACRIKRPAGRRREAVCHLFLIRPAPYFPRLSAGRHSCRGQALIESCLVVALICLILAGLFQLLQLYAAKEILSYACARGARARTVGFNDFMARKSVMAAAIPNAGNMIFPETAGGPAAQMAMEHARIPIYLSAEWSRLNGILQYEDWETINYNYTEDSSHLLRFAVSQDFPLRFFPVFFRAFHGADSVPLNTELYLDNHAALYLE